MLPNVSQFASEIDLIMKISGDRKIVKKPDSTIVKKQHSTIVKKQDSTIVNLFSDKLVGSQPYSTIVKKVDSRTVQLSKKFQMIFTGKIFHL